MSYIQNNLTKNEKIIKEAQTSMLAIIPNTIVAVIVIVMFAAMSDGYFSITSIGIILDVFILLIPIIRIKCTHLGLTNKKIIGKTGIINIKSMEAPLNKVDNISVQQGLIGRIFNYGTLNIHTSSGKYDFKFIVHPDEFKKEVMNYADEYEQEKLRIQAENMYKGMFDKN